MGELIDATAKVDRIADHVRTSYQNGIARTGEIADATKARLEAPILAIEKQELLLKDAEKTASVSWVLVKAADGPADLTIGSVRDEMWNAMGRPHKCTPLEEVFPDGIGTYTEADPMDQPLLMEVLMARIIGASAPQWTEAKRIAWAATIDAVRVPYADAVTKHRPIAAAQVVAEAGYKAAVKAGHTGMRCLKRDLKSLGLTEAQIHEIIPDAGKPRSKETTKKEG